MLEKRFLRKRPQRKRVARIAPRQKQRITVMRAGKPVEISANFRPGNKSPIVFLSGMGCSQTDFRKVFGLKDFEGHPIVTFDFPGQGGKNGTPVPRNFKFTMEELADLTKSVIDHYRLQNVVLVGHSMGGVVGKLFMNKYPSTLRQFINVEGSVSASASTKSVQFAALTSQKFRRQFGTFAEGYKNSGEHGERLYGDTFARSNPDAIHGYSKDLAKLYNGGELLGKFLRGDEKAGHIRRVYVHGAQSRYPWVETMKNAGIEVVDIPNAGHYIFSQNPDYFFTKLKQLIR